MRDELESRWSDLGAFIREQRRLGQLSLRKLSEMAGVSNPYLSQIERGLRRPSAEILQQIARALSISAETLYVRAGILDPDDEQATLLDHILGAPELSDDQKMILARIYRSFVQENKVDDRSAPAAPAATAATAGADDADGAANAAGDEPGVDPPAESLPA